MVRSANGSFSSFFGEPGNDGGAAKRLGGININVKTDDTQRIQEMHILIGHIICDLVEKSL